MAFFPRTFYNSESSFTPLFRLLDDFDNYNRQGTGQQQGRRSGLPTWQPKFDIRETGDNYELHGELAGMNKDNVHIEFTDPQTMLVRGRVERTYSAGTPPAGHIEDAPANDAITEGADESKPSHRATVEDDDQNAASTQKPASDNNGAVAEHKVEHKKSADKAKYWLTERSIGEFSRSFNFPTRIDQEAVSANFKDGILSITVPKIKKHESRRITIN
ncbi:hsp20/alpha crystallin family protein [Hirsutella rhossiliensis]|uniref:Hsp20/alpha crystallin family domain-containing protein n=1 Tax=Hirsutella rhossiliensis TaxID=111463 RepID=A0A9P8MJG2_9HYPO|nr:hsp20/alpha crystallin family domain-containing protein [Hirsutella rhossiliensis]KAH0957478.1 hsp20/alpha crystallin family domain-containing protein [Hirsutella rhossiliensis]